MKKKIWKKKETEEHEYATGILRVHPRGFGFLQADEKELYPEDVFIPKHATQGAVDGDRVEVIVLRGLSEKGPEGKVQKVLQRGRSHVAGTIVAVNKKGGGYAYVPLLGVDDWMAIAPTEDRRLQIGDRIIIHVLDWGGRDRETSGEMSAYIGHISDPSCDIAAAIEEYELEDAFSQKVISEAQAFGTQASLKEIKTRTDLRELECITIDPDTAKDFDDALSISQDKHGNYHLGVHIADVSHYVKPGTELDREAKLRCNSVYFPGHVLPMLPHELSSHLCSLKPDVNRLTISVLMQIDPTGHLIDYKIIRSVIRSQKRFTYREAKEVLDGKRKSPHDKALFLMVDLCHRLKRKRYERGSIEFALPDVVVKVDPQGVPHGIEIVEYDISHQLVEEFMLKANEIVATHLSKEGKPLTYRIHDVPAEENIKEFAAIATALGFVLSPIPTTEELQHFFDEARESAFGQFLMTSFIRCMKLASYSTENIGHYGLSLEHYTHFTSPIRRYIDLIVHRLLFESKLIGTDLEEIALQCSEKERLSARAENSVTALKKLRLLKDFVEKHPQHQFQAVITSVKPFGFAFELTDFLMEGFLHVSALSDHYTFIEKKKCLQGHKTFQTGDQITLMVKNINLTTQTTDWALLDEVRHTKLQKKKKWGRSKK